MTLSVNGGKETPPLCMPCFEQRVDAALRTRRAAPEQTVSADPFLDALPGILRDHRQDLGAALARPVPAGEWPSDVEYMDAEQPSAVASVLIDAIHTDLRSARIAYVYRQDMARHGKMLLAHIKRAGALMSYLVGFDYIVEVNWTAYRALSALQRVALMDHELSHAIKENDAWRIIGHDLEEFGSIVQRYGLWYPDVERFARVIAHQRDLFDAGVRA